MLNYISARIRRTYCRSYKGLSSAAPEWLEAMEIMGQFYYITTEQVNQSLLDHREDGTDMIYPKHISK